MYLAAAVWAVVCFYSVPALASMDEDMDIILEKKNHLDGVVFEIVTGNEKSLETIIPKISKAIERLRKKWPKIGIAIVSHGTEQFALKKSNAGKYDKLHKEIQSITKDNVDFHVCGTYASWHDTEPEDFLGFIDVSISGPAQISDYLKLGYILVPANPD